MSLVHSSREQGDSGLFPALEPLDDDEDTGLNSLSSLAEEAVPMRDHAARELGDMREERIRAVVGGRGRPLLPPTVNARVLVVGGAAVVILVLVAALSSSGGGSAARGGGATQPSHPAAAKLSGQDRQAKQPQRLVKAHPRRQAAIPAKRRAARRHAKRERPHRRAANAEAVPSQSDGPVAESPPPVSAPPPPTATTESAPPPASAPPPSSSSDPAGEQFGFER
jgi:hypothetical protein